MNIEEFKASEKIPLIVVLDDVRSMYNVGSIFRTSDAFRTESIWLCGITARPPHPEIHKTALGAEDSMEWRYFATTHEAIEALMDDGSWRKGKWQEKYRKEPTMANALHPYHEFNYDEDLDVYVYTFVRPYDD